LVPDYDDDDIVEDYEEVSSDSARRVASGGPVQRPNAGGRPAASAVPTLPQSDEELAAAQKGKISKKSAKLIWIICIAVTSLGVGAVLVDLLIDPLGRHKATGGGGNAVANNTPTPRANRREENLSPEQKLQREFLTDVINKMKAMDTSKAWDFYWLAYLEFDDAYGKAATLKKDGNAKPEELEEAWALAIKHYYKAKYAGELFRFRFDKDNISKGYMPITLEGDEVTFLDEATLKDENVRWYQAAESKIQAKSVSINLFKTDILKSELTAQKVHESKEWSDKHFGQFKAQWEAAAGERKFPQEDLDFVNGPDYKSGEKKLYEAYLESKGG
jgi:hypothetical protein